MHTCQFTCWMASVTDGLRTRHNVRRLKAVAKRANSARTLAKPRKEEPPHLPVHVLDGLCYGWSTDAPTASELSASLR